MSLCTCSTRGLSPCLICPRLQIFVWIGKDANETEKSGSLKIGELRFRCVTLEPSETQFTFIALFWQLKTT